MTDQWLREKLAELRLHLRYVAEGGAEDIVGVSSAVEVLMKTMIELFEAELKG